MQVRCPTFENHFTLITPFEFVALFCIRSHHPAFRRANVRCEVGRARWILGEVLKTEWYLLIVTCGQVVSYVSCRLEGPPICIDIIVFYSFPTQDSFAGIRNRYKRFFGR